MDLNNRELMARAILPENHPALDYITAAVCGSVDAAIFFMEACLGKVDEGCVFWSLDVGKYGENHSAWVGPVYTSEEWKVNIGCEHASQALVAVVLEAVADGWIK